MPSTIRLPATLTIDLGFPIMRKNLRLPSTPALKKGTTVSVTRVIVPLRVKFSEESNASAAAWLSVRPSSTAALKVAKRGMRSFISAQASSTPTTADAASAGTTLRSPRCFAAYRSRSFFISRPRSSVV